MGAFLLDLFPELLDGIVIGRIGRQLKNRHAVLMLGEERLHRGTDRILGAILNEDHVLASLRQDAGKVGRIAG